MRTDLLRRAKHAGDGWRNRIGDDGARAPGRPKGGATMIASILV